jgi:hypothetical protein
VRVLLVELRTIRWLSSLASRSASRARAQRSSILAEATEQCFGALTEIRRPLFERADAARL